MIGNERIYLDWCLTGGALIRTPASAFSPIILPDSGKLALNSGSSNDQSATDKGCESPKLVAKAQPSFEMTTHHMPRLSYSMVADEQALESSG